MVEDAMREEMEAQTMGQGEATRSPHRLPVVITNAFIPFSREDIEQSIPSRFEHQVRLYPDRLAVKTRQHTWTYDMLNRVANRVAHAILECGGEGRTPVVLLLEQGAPMVAALLGVLKAGKIVVLLDPSHPASRLAQMINEAQPTCILTNHTYYEVAAALADEACACIDMEALAARLSDTNPGRPNAPDDPATILYTSGSTGQPKGVLVNHRSWLHNTMNYTNTFHLCPEDRLTLLSFATTQALKNLLLALLNGAPLFPYDVRADGLDDLVALMRREEITVTVMSASLFRAFVDILGSQDIFPTLRLIRLGSELVHKRDVALYKQHFASHCLLVNGLASSETLTVRFYPIDHDTDIPGRLVPVGYAVEDKAILLLDDIGKEVEGGQVGEIVVKSRYLSLGYWRRPDLTEAVFRTDETPGGLRLYHTGDLGRMHPDGCLECLGRKNARVKIRGHGVDLIEIELTLHGIDNIKEAVVVAHENRAGYPYLVAYVVPVTFPAPTTMTLRQALAQTLPDVMIPSTFVVMGALPRTTAGKLDRQALPAPGHPRRDPYRPITLPRTPMEATLAGIWSDILGHEHISVYDHFYELGGDSLQAMRIMARVRKTFNADLDLQALLEAPTVADMTLSIIQCLLAKMAPPALQRLLEGV
jgi:amino acid adenylation domain-containing protein